MDNCNNRKRSRFENSNKIIDGYGQKRAWMFVILVAAFLMAFIYNVLTPYMSDDLWYHPGEWISWGEVWAKTWTNYMTWNGRLVPQYLMALSLNVPKLLFNIVNSLMFVALGWLIYVNIMWSIADGRVCYGRRQGVHNGHSLDDRRTCIKGSASEACVADSGSEEYVAENGAGIKKCIEAHVTGSTVGLMLGPFLLALIYLALWNLGIDPGQTLLWIGGACNYLWATVISLGFMTLFRYLLNKETSYLGCGLGLGISCNNESADDRLVEGQPVQNLLEKRSTTGEYSGSVAQEYSAGLWLEPLMLLLGLLAGFCNENTSGAIMLLTVYYAVVFVIGNKDNQRKTCNSNTSDEKSKLPLWAYCGIAGELLGLLGLVVSPGGKIRLEQNLADETNTGLLAYLGRLLKLNDYVLEYLWAPCLLIIVLLVYMWVRRSSKGYALELNSCGSASLEIDEPTAYILAAIAAIYVLLATTTPMPRALFGAQILLFIACGKLIVRLWDVSWVKTFVVSLVLGWALFTGMNYVENAANLVRINRELDEREELIEEQRGAEVVVVPRLRPEWDNKYTFIYPNDLTDDPENERNVSSRIYYDLNCIVAVDREVWEQ